MPINRPREDIMQHQDMTKDMKACVEECLRCHAVCLGMASHHCLVAGGKHVAVAHFRLMLACAEACQSAANFMLIRTDKHKAMCGLCAEICEACAASCEQLGDMQDCVDACRRCAQSCRSMAA